MSQTLHVVGSGLAGTLAALYLAQQQEKVVLLERRPDLRKVEQPAGRSINLALSARGLYALQEVGLAEQVLAQALPMKGRMMHDRQGQLTFQAYGLHPHECIYSISRAALNQVLLDAAEAAGVEIRFQQRATGMDFEQRQLEMLDETTGQVYTLSQTPVIGADGAGSALRRSLIQRVRVNYQQDYLEHGYKELSMPPGPQGDFQLDPGALHIWPRQHFMLIALPNPDRSFTCTLFLDFEGAESFEQLQTPEAVSAFFAAQFGDVPPLIPDLCQQFFDNPTGVLATIRTAPWQVDDQLLLLGDAAHAIVPFFGQGMNAAFEDCTVLAALQREARASGTLDWAELFARFFELRKANAEAIADLALENFIEMRDKVADPAFLLRKRVSLELEARYPESFIPKYSLVSFHRVPYRAALQQGELQQALLTELIGNTTTFEAIDWQKAPALMARYQAEIASL